MSADSVVPGAGNPQALNRYAYNFNNPVKYVDPSGHRPAEPEEEEERPPEDKDPFIPCKGDWCDLIGVLPSGPGGGIPFIPRAGGTGGRPATTIRASVAAGPQSIVASGVPTRGSLSSQSNKPCSFAAETLVVTAKGTKSIHLLKVGDLIYAYHEALGITAIYTVTQVWVHVDPVIVLLTIEGEVIEATPEHPFFVEGYGWVAAGNLWTAARIRKLNGNYGLVQSVEIVQREQAMYNLSVAEAHTFFVGGGEWLVHNDGCGDRLPFYKGGKTQGILDTGTDEIDLISGRPTGERKLPPNAPGSKLIIADHVEAQASAIMRNRGLMEADLYINNTPCSGTYGCNAMLEHMLPEGARLNMYIKLGPDNWENRFYMGLPDSAYRGPR